MIEQQPVPSSQKVTNKKQAEGSLKPVGTCQLGTIPSLVETMGSFEKSWQIIRRIRRFVKRRWTYLVNRGRAGRKKNGASLVNLSIVPLKPGDRVRIKSRQEIQATLNNWNHLGGCGFMEEMWALCGQEHTVLKRVERFLDERDYLIKRTNHLVLLDGIHCQGTRDFGRCDRYCFYFWREEWLEKIPEPTRRLE